MPTTVETSSRDYNPYVEYFRLFPDLSISRSGKTLPAAIMTMVVALSPNIG
jgi:hypothetical protein